jgi:hypothetical protein
MDLFGKYEIADFKDKCPTEINKMNPSKINSDFLDKHVYGTDNDGNPYFSYQQINAIQKLIDVKEKYQLFSRCTQDDDNNRQKYYNDFIKMHAEFSPKGMA